MRRYGTFQKTIQKIKIEPRNLAHQLAAPASKAKAQAAPAPRRQPRQVLYPQVFRELKQENRDLRSNLQTIIVGRDTLAADLEASKKSLVAAAAKTEQQRHRADYYEGNLKQTRTLLSVTATKLTATDKEARETEQHRAEACAEIESLREQLGIKTTELAELQGRFASTTAERNTLWSLVPPIPVAQFEVRRLIDIDRAGVQPPPLQLDIDI